MLQNVQRPWCLPNLAPRHSSAVLALCLTLILLADRPCRKPDELLMVPYRYYLMELAMLTTVGLLAAPAMLS